MTRGHQVLIATGAVEAPPMAAATADNTFVTELSLAVDELFRSRDGETYQHTELLQIKLFGRDAEVARHLAVGSLVTIEGRLFTERGSDGAGAMGTPTWIYTRPGGLTLHGSDHAKTAPEHTGRGRGALRGPMALHTPGGGDDDLSF